MTGFIRWRSADHPFADWSRNGVQLNSDGALILAPDAAAHETDPYAPGAYNGGNFYNGGSYMVGEAASPTVTTDFAFTEAIASWNADTPAGTLGRSPDQRPGRRAVDEVV